MHGGSIKSNICLHTNLCIFFKNLQNQKGNKKLWLIIRIRQIHERKEKIDVSGTTASLKKYQNVGRYPSWIHGHFKVTDTSIKKEKNAQKKFLMNIFSSARSMLVVLPLHHKTYVNKVETCGNTILHLRTHTCIWYFRFLHIQDVQTDDVLAVVDISVCST